MEAMTEMATTGDGKTTEFVTPKQAAQLRGVHISTIYYALERGDLTNAIEGTKLLRRSAVMDWEPKSNSRRRQSPGPAGEDNQ